MFRLRCAAAAIGTAAVLTGVLLAPTAVSATTPTPPTQPATGPGGASTPWSSATETFHANVNGDLNYWTFVPAGWTGGGSAPTHVPIMVFLHGYGALDPSWYQDWINHETEEGNIVIYPQYQASYLTLPSLYTSNATTATKNAITWLQANAAPAPDLSAGMVLASHSYGGPIAVNMANEYVHDGLPTPKAIMLAEPFNQSIDSSLAGIPASTEIDCLVGDHDTNVGRTGCDAVWDRTGNVANRDYIWMYSDSHGSPGLTADHFAPTTAPNNTTNALDWYGTWKLTDGLRDCGLYGTNCAYAQGNTSQQTFMGYWSDGVAVKPLMVTTTKPPCPAGSTAIGCP